MIKRILFLSFLSLSLILTQSGCSGMHLASLASVAVTGKSFSDHALSKVTGQDCAFLNVIDGEQVCYSNDFVEMTLLTSNQHFDTTLKEVIHQPVDVPAQQPNEQLSAPKQNLKRKFLVIGSFSQRFRAESFQSDYQQWNSKVVASNDSTAAIYRVVIGPVAQEDKARLKRIFINKGVETPWLMTL